MKTRVTNFLGIRCPVIQGGMAWVADYHLAAAVSEAGGLGMLSLIHIWTTANMNHTLILFSRRCNYHDEFEPSVFRS